MTPKEILELREELDLSQEKFGRLLGVGQKTVSRWEVSDGSKDVPTGPPAVILMAMRTAMDEDRDTVRSFLRRAADVGGLGYMLRYLFKMTARRKVRTVS